MNADWLNQPGGREAAAALSVFNRVGTVEDVAALVRYLASPAAQWTTGRVLDVTGGSAI
jgi:NAD(P)-dependent dehydrogenase (short-subunit alcohol dehydrogenase family)